MVVSPSKSKSPEKTMVEVVKVKVESNDAPSEGRQEETSEQRDESSGDERCSKNCPREDSSRDIKRKRGRKDDREESEDPPFDVPTLNSPSFANLGTNSFGGLSFTERAAGIAAVMNTGSTHDLGEPFNNISMSQDQAWEILNQDSFGFNLGQGTLSLSFSNDGDDGLVLPYPSEGIETRVSELNMENCLDSSDLKKGLDLSSAVTESLDGPGTPSKVVGDDGDVKKNPFYPHDYDVGHVPPTPPSTQSAPLVSTLPPRKRESREDRHRSRRSHRSSRESSREQYDRYSQDVSFSQSKSEDYYYDRPRHHLRSTGGKRSGTRSGSRRHRSMKPYHRGEPMSSSPPPLPSMGSAPSPRTRSSEMMGWVPNGKRFKSSSRHGRESRSDRYSRDVARDPHSREQHGSARHHPGASVANHPWHPGPIRPNARYPHSPSNAAPSPSRSQPTAPPAQVPSAMHLSHPYSQQNMMAPHGYPYHSPASHHMMSSHLPHPVASGGESVPRAFLPPPPPQFTNTKSDSGSSNVPPREVYILSSSNASSSAKPPPPPPSQFHPSPSSTAPPPLPPPHTRASYPIYPPAHHHPPTHRPTTQTQPQLQGTSLLGPLTREQAPGIGWPPEEDVLLTECMTNHKSPVDWEVIAREHGRSRTARECHDRWTRYLKPGARKGQWREEEDAIVLRVIAQSAEPTFTQWADLAPQLPGRSGKQIRDRWVNYLNPAINHLPFSREDDLRLWEGHNKLGKRWVEISVKVFNSTRSENHIKNRWYSAAFKKFIANEFGPNAYVDAKAGE